MDPQLYLCNTASRRHIRVKKHIHSSARTVRDVLFKKAANEEVKETSKKTNIKNNKQLIVSGDGTWKKRGFTSLYGVSAIIGYYSGKVVDVMVKSAYCKICETWEKKKGTAEFDE